jgi:hypothetical protein
MAARTSPRREPEHEASDAEDDDRRHPGHENEPEPIGRQAHSITCAMPSAPVGTRNADAARGAATRVMRRRFNRSLCLGVVERTLRTSAESAQIGRDSDKSRARDPSRIGHDRVTSRSGVEGHAGGVNLGIKLRLQGIDGGDLGIAHAPAPVERGDVLALADGSIWRVVNLIDLNDLGSITRVIDMLCMVEPA